MDKNTVIGLLLIFIVIFGFSWFNRPSEEQLARQKAERDSIENVKAQALAHQIEVEAEKAEADSLAAIGEIELDSAKLEAKYGDFAMAGIGVEKLDTVSNGKLNIVFSNRGGCIKSVEIVGEQRYDSLPYMVYDKDEAHVNFALVTRNRILNTQDLFFKPIICRSDSNIMVKMRLEVDADRWFDIDYLITNDSYTVETSLLAHNLTEVLAQNVQTIDMQADQLIRQNEKGRKFELRYSALNYKYTGDDVDLLSESKSDREQLSGNVKWVAFKDQFFSNIFIANESFTAVDVESEVMNDRSEFIRKHKMLASLPFDPRGERATTLTNYFGPNKYKVLRSFDDGVENDAEKLELYKVIPMGWKVFSWISTLIIIPVFDFLSRWVSSYGIIILLMTILLKIVIFPLMFKSFKSQAIMRHLRPEMAQINEKYPAEKAMERQQATMALYKKAGASPMSGCLPMLLQWPVLIAMFSFFPTCFELRGESFLWAKDLSAYDALIEWNTYIPLISWAFSNHISLFCLLMTVVNIVYMKLNMAGQPTGNDMNAKMMKWMMYLMPVMFLFMFNNYSSGLSYYYFLSLLLSIFQTYMFRLFISREMVEERMKNYKEKPGKKKSGFMARLEAAQRQQQEMMRKQAAEQAKKNRR